MKTKVLIVGILLSALIIGGIGGVSGLSSISANQTEYLPSEHVGVSGYCEAAVAAGCGIYVCSCDVVDVSGYTDCPGIEIDLSGCDNPVSGVGYGSYN